jgi:hypothetical protein
VRVTLSRGSLTQSALANRRDAPETYTESYTLPTTVETGRYTALIEFFADPDGRGSSVATGAADVTLLDDGTGIGQLALTGAVKSVAVLPGQSVGYGQARDLNFEARTSSGALLALSPGSAFGTVAGGADRLQLQRGIMSTASVTLSPERSELGAGQTATLTAGTVGAAETGIDWSAPSGGSVTASGAFTAPSVVGEFPVIARSRWDPKKLAQATIVVVPSVTVTPTSTVTTLRKTLTLRASVLGPSDTSVRWSVTEPGGGTVSASGLYTAPATPGTFRVVAESVADPRQRATATITIQSGNGNITIQ